ncbi:hypothetical protein [Oceaniferula spumae]
MDKPPFTQQTTLVWLVAICFLVALAPQTSLAQALPVWSAEDRAKLSKGELIAGAGLLVDDSAASELPEVAPDPEVPSLPPEEPEPVYDPEVIPEEFLSAYFSATPKTYLIDPQQLLSRQEAMDREGFLEYHAADSAVDIRLYLFDAEQKIPAGYTLQALAEERYANSNLTAVVFCFLGNPSRNMLAFGGKGADSLDSEEVRKMLEVSILKAMEKSEPAGQVEAFVVQLSIKLYWMERAIAKEQVAQGNTMGVTTEAEKKSQAETPAATGAFTEIKPYLPYIVIGGSGVTVSCVALAAAIFLWRRSRKYHFPVLEIPRRLGADYGAGVGAVIAFHNKQGSPSSQRDQVPDYLTRM